MMRIKALITSAMMGSMTLLSHAQEAAPPSVDLYSGQKQPEVAATTSLEPTAPGVPELSQLDEAFRKTSLGKEAGESRLQEAGKAIARSR
jgi:hypothetical protein